MDGLEAGIDNMLGQLAELSDVKDKLYSKVVEYAYDDEKLEYFSRLNGEKPLYILKNYILIDFFQDYYSELDVKLVFEKIDSPPYYKKKIDFNEKDKELRKKCMSKYPEFIKRFMRLTVSEGGEGRKEAFGLLRSLDQEMQKDRLMNFRRMGRNI